MKTALTCEWWNDENRQFTEQEQEILQRAAIDRAEEMMREGYIAGELCEEIDGQFYRGWWEVKTT